MEFSYRIVWESSFQTLADEIRRISGFRAKKICVVSDSNVAPLYAGEVEKALAPLGLTVETYVFPAGEEHKCLDTVNGLYRFLIGHKFQRNDILAALGGGVAGDLFCGSHLSARHRFYPDTNHPARAGGQQCRRKNRCRF